MLLEAGDRQPRSLADAFRTPREPHVGPAVQALCRHLSTLDRVYATGEERRHLCVQETQVPESRPGSLADLANWARDLAGAGATS